MLIIIITIIRLHLLEPDSSVGECTEGPLSTATWVVHCITRGTHAVVPYGVMQDTA